MANYLKRMMENTEFLVKKCIICGRKIPFTSSKKFICWRKSCEVEHRRLYHLYGKNWKEHSVLDKT